MKKVFLLPCFLASSWSFAGPGDSLNLRNIIAPYFQLGAHVGIGEAGFTTDAGKYWLDPFERTFLDRLNYRFCTPVFTGGLIIRKKRRMYKIDGGYFFGAKKIERVYGGNGKNPDDNVLTNHMNSKDFYFNQANYVGSSYYRFKDSVSADVYLSYVEVNQIYGRNLGKHLNVLFGTRASFFVGSAYDGTIKRQVDEYAVTGATLTNGQVVPVETHGSTYDVVYTRSSDLKRLMGQDLASNFYLCLGMNGMYSIDDKIVMFEARLDYNLPLYRNAWRSYVTFSVSWLLKDLRRRNE